MRAASPTDGPDEFSTRPLSTDEDSANGAADSTFELIVGRGRILTTPSPIVAEGDVAVVAIGDPTIADFDVLPNTRMLRLTGKRPGITDLTMVTSDGQTLVYELHVQYDLRLLEARLQESFPGALVEVSQLGTNLILKGQARDQIQSNMIENAVRAYLDTLQNIVPMRLTGGATAASSELVPETPDETADEQTLNIARLLRALPEATPRTQLT